MGAIGSILSIYFYVLVGYFSKKVLTDKIDEKSLVILSIYVLQPFLTFWGLLKRDIDTQLLQAPLIYLGIIALVIAINFLLSGYLFHDHKDRSIFIIAGIVGNTGNLGIPLGLMLFGDDSIALLTIINLANVLVVSTLGVYFYSRGSFNAKESLLNILKLPSIWFALIAIILNILGFRVEGFIEESLKMGAYASITLQLLILGIYLSTVRISTIDYRLNFAVVGVKFVLLPLVAFLVVQSLDVSVLLKKVLFLEMVMPLAIVNVNLASLYECKPKEVVSSTFITSLLFLILVFIYIFIMNLIQ